MSGIEHSHARRQHWKQYAITATIEEVNSKSPADHIFIPEFDNTLHPIIIT